jgi:hypothetical protein
MNVSNSAFYKDLQAPEIDLKPLGPNYCGPQVAFYTSASFAALALLGLLQKIQSLPRASKLPTAV